MKLITIDSEAYKSLVRKIDRIYNYLAAERERKAVPLPDPTEVWIDNDEAAFLLEVSQRTLQRLRSNGEITYSIRGGRTRYRLSEVQKLVPGRVIASKYKQEEDFLRAHLDYYEKRKDAKTKKKK